MLLEKSVSDTGFSEFSRDEPGWTDKYDCENKRVSLRNPSRVVQILLAVESGREGSSKVQGTNRLDVNCRDCDGSFEWLCIPMRLGFVEGGELGASLEKAALREHCLKSNPEGSI